MKIWVNGAEGFIGSYLTEFLASSNKDFVSTSQYGSPTLFDRSCVKCDITSIEDVKKILTEYKPEIIFHMAAQSLPNLSFDNPYDTLNKNVVGSLNIFTNVLEFVPSSQVIIAATSAQYGDVDAENIPVNEDHSFWPLQPYGVSKATMELLAYQLSKSHGLQYKSARIFNTTGARKKNDVCNDFWDRISKEVITHIDKKEIKIKTGTLNTKRAYMDVRDTVSGLITISQSGLIGHAYNICGENLYTGQDILDIFSSQLGLKVSSQISKELLRATDEKVIYGDTQKLKSLGWKQKFILSDTVKDIVNDSK